MGPGGNVGQLTEHRPLWTGTHDTVQSPPDTIQKCKAQTDTEARQGAQVHLVEPMSKDCMRRTPNLVTDPATKCVSGLVSDSRTDTPTHLEPVSAEVQVQAVDAVPELETTQACKFSVDASANQEKARHRKESTGEHQQADNTVLSVSHIDSSILTVHDVCWYCFPKGKSFTRTCLTQQSRLDVSLTSTLTHPSLSSVGVRQLAPHDRFIPLRAHNTQGAAS